MRNQIDYFEKVIKILKDLKREYPSIEVSKHYILSTDNAGFSLTDKELFHALQKHKGELDMNTLSEEDMEEVIKDADSMFISIDEEEWDTEEDSWNKEDEDY